MYTLSWSKGFQRGFKRAIRKNPELQERIFSTLETLSREPFRPDLKTHKLHGKLVGLWACEVEYGQQGLDLATKDLKDNYELYINELPSRQTRQTSINNATTKQRPPLHSKYLRLIGSFADEEKSSKSTNVPLYCVFILRVKRRAGPIDSHKEHQRFCTK